VPASYVGPGVADGTAVFVDTFGTVHALAAEDGTELWSAELHRPVGGVPVLRDGRVYLAGLGRPEDIDRRDYRVAAYDLATGRFLASWEPPILGFWNVPFVSPGGPGGPGGPDALLVPTGGDFNDIVMGVRPVG
jgi:outer membrane protein assembly factor BamB